MSPVVTLLNDAKASYIGNLFFKLEDKHKIKGVDDASAFTEKGKERVRG